MPDAPHDRRGFQGLERLGQKAGILFGGHGMGALLGFVALLAIGRYYAPEAYGAYLFAVSLVGIVSTLFQLGFNQAHSREVARGVDVARALGVYLRIRLALNAVKIVVVLAALGIWFGLLDRGLTDATSLQVVVIILASSILVNIRNVASDTWTGQGRVHRVEWTRFIDSVVYAGSIVVVGLGLGAASGRWVPLPGVAGWVADVLALPADATGLVVAQYVAMGHFLGKVAGITITAVWWLRDKTEVGPWDGALANDYRRFALPVALTSILALVLQHTDVLMLGFFWTAREVGWYGAAQRLANVALLAAISFRGLLMPYFASLFSRGEDERAMRAFRRVERFLLVAVVPAAVAMIVWARQGLHIFVGNSFLDAAAPLRWLAAWTIVSAMNMPVRAKHMGAGYTGILVGASILNVSANVVLNLLLIPESLLGIPLAGMGPEGAAIATFASTTLAYAWNRIQAARLYGIPLVDRAQVKLAAAGVAPAAAWMWMRGALPASAYDRFWELMAIGMAGMAVYGAALWLVKGLRRDDVQLLARVFHPRELLREARGKG